MEFRSASHDSLPKLQRQQLLWAAFYLWLRSEAPEYQTKTHGASSHLDLELEQGNLLPWESEPIRSENVLNNTVYKCTLLLPTSWNADVSVTHIRPCSWDYYSRDGGATGWRAPGSLRVLVEQTCPQTCPTLT